MIIVKEITKKSNTLPFELQREVLDFVDFIARKEQVESESAPLPFRNARGILNHRNLENLEADLTEIRDEMWNNFQVYRTFHPVCPWC